jgi:hypothetical protein
MSTELSDLLGPPSWLSECCGAVSWGELHLDDAKVQAVGICSGCKDHATFMLPEDDKPEWPRRVFYGRTSLDMTTSPEWVQRQGDLLCPRKSRK